MMTIKVSSKRQATFPKQVCEALGVQPGDDLLLDRRVENGQEVWLLRPKQAYHRPWLGSLRKYAKGKSHDMDAIRESIARKRLDDEKNQ